MLLLCKIKHIKSAVINKYSMSTKSPANKVVMIRYQDFKFDTISIRYSQNIAIIVNKDYVNLIKAK